MVDTDKERGSVFALHFLLAYNEHADGDSSVTNSKSFLAQFCNFPDFSWLLQEQQAYHSALALAIRRYRHLNHYIPPRPFFFVVRLAQLEIERGRAELDWKVRSELQDSSIRPLQTHIPGKGHSGNRCLPLPSVSAMFSYQVSPVPAEIQAGRCGIPRRRIRWQGAAALQEALGMLRQAAPANQGLVVPAEGWATPSWAEDYMGV